LIAKEPIVVPLEIIFLIPGWENRAAEFFLSRGFDLQKEKVYQAAGDVIMAKTRFFVVILLVQAAIIFSPNLGLAETSPSLALSGHVSSQEEGPMEGVLVSAKRENSTITITVISDAHGQFSFPRTKLDPGRYALRIRAVGYDLSDPGPLEVAAQKTTQLDLKLVKTKDLAAQLTNAEWLMSAPGTEEQKMQVGCYSCHTLERVFRSHYTAADFKSIVHRMSSYDPGSSPERGPQIATDGAREMRVSPEYLSTINLSSVSQWQFPLKTFPRPKGNATRVIITEYDLPRRESMPHDVILDANGIVWYGDFGSQYLGRLDPKTGKVVEYPVPLLKPGFPTGYRVLWPDPQGNIWISMAAQAAVTKFDPKTEKFQIWKVPDPADGKTNERATMVQPEHLDVDGKIWVQLRGGKIQRLDARTGEWDREPISAFGYFAKGSPAESRPHAIYDTVADSQNNVYFTDIESEYIGRINAKSKEVTYYQTPTFNSGPHRGHVDQQDRFWFAEDRSSGIGMLDPETGRIQEWKVPTPFSESYDVSPDKNGDAWEGGMTTDRVARLNPKTGKIVEYLLPRPTNIRKVEVDNSTNPVTVWVGGNHGAFIAKLEPLE
jgi:virginiamycin B lyase